MTPLSWQGGAAKKMDYSLQGRGNDCGEEELLKLLRNQESGGGGLAALLLKDWAATWTVNSWSVGSGGSAPYKGGRDRGKPGQGVIGSWDL